MENNGLTRPNPAILSGSTYLLESMYTDPHPGMHVRLGRLQMVVEVVSESQDLEDASFGGILSGEMTRKEN